MAKSNKPHRKEEEKSKSPAHHRPEIYKVVLIMGRWKKLFTEHECKVMIAEALNYCTHTYKEVFQVTGYLITNRRLYLLLKENSLTLDELLHLFTIQLRQELKKAYFRQYLWIDESSITKEQNKKEEHFVELFTRHPLYNDDLVKLITGRKVRLPYYYPHLARLENYIHNYNFCSAIDYSGGIGPVVVALRYYK